jgi:hypothetical protein
VNAHYHLRSHPVLLKTYPVGLKLSKPLKVFVYSKSAIAMAVFSRVSPVLVHILVKTLSAKHREMFWQAKPVKTPPKPT